ncbi:7TM chemoreceptor [Ostertagia ostertagi]
MRRLSVTSMPLQYRDIARRDKSGGNLPLQQHGALSIFFRVIPGGHALFLISNGPCKLFGRFACYVGYSFMMHCHAHWLWSLLLSFSYRYYILFHPAPKNSTIVYIIALLYIPSFIQFVTFCFTSDNAAELKMLVTKKYGYDVTSECVNGHLNIFNWKVMFTIFHMTLPITPVYIAILFLRRLTIAKLRTERTMSENSRRLHEQLLMALTIQACLPVFFLIAVVIYTIEQFDIYNHPVLEYSIFLVGSFIPLLSALTSFYFVRPYRVWIRENLFCLRKIIRSQTTTSMVMTRSSSDTSKLNI